MSYDLGKMLVKKKQFSKALYIFQNNSLFIGAIVMAIWIGFIRPEGLQGTWGFFNLVFAQNVCAFLVGIYTIKINKLGHTEKTSNEGIIAPGVLTILSGLLCYGLADKIY